jgi:hypothetical protein
MSIEEIKKNLIAFEGNKFIYAKSCNENAEAVFFCKTLSINEMKLIDENPALLITQD